MEDRTNFMGPKPDFVPVRLNDQTVIRIEATRLKEEESEEDYIGVQLPSFEEITNTIKGISKSIVAVWNEVQPSKATAEFGIEVGFEPGNVTSLLVKGSGKANLKITLEWEQKSSSEPSNPT